MSSYLSLSLIILISLTHSVSSQQSYDPSVCRNSTSALGYACNGLKTQCQTYLIFRSQPPYTTASAISSLFGSDPSLVARLNNVSESAPLATRKEMIIPATCSCSGRYYQSNTTYVVRTHDSPFAIANATFQGLTTCKAIQRQRSGLVEDMFPDEKLTIPLRCACPTRNQSIAGVKYLMSYLIKSGDTISTVALRFGADVGETLQANMKSVQDFIIQPFTTLLVPLRSPPNSSMTDTPQGAPLPPPPPPEPEPARHGRAPQKWNYFLYGLIAGSGFVLMIFGAFGFSSRRRKTRGRQVISSKSDDLEQPLELLEIISRVAPSLKVISFKHMQSATDNFSSSTRIGGSVYRGELPIEGQVAIKRTEIDVSSEIEILNKINHCNIIRLIGVCYNNGLWYVVYEYATNGRLSDWIFSKARHLSWERRVQIAHDVATGLEYLHGYTIPQQIHTDLKCSHVLLDSEFRAKIAHFGLSKSVGGGFGLTRHIVGTKGYMAPEYVEHGLVTTKMDVYAFGIFVVEMLAGKEAGSLSLSEVMKAVVVDGNEKVIRELLDPGLRDECRLDVAVEMLRLAERCVRKEPSDRPGMDEVVRLLSKVLVTSDQLIISSDHSEICNECD